MQEDVSWKEWNVKEEVDVESEEMDVHTAKSFSAESSDSQSQAETSSLLLSALFTMRQSTSIKRPLS